MVGGTVGITVRATAAIVGGTVGITVRATSAEAPADLIGATSVLDGGPAVPDAETAQTASPAATRTARPTMDNARIGREPCPGGGIVPHCRTLAGAAFICQGGGVPKPGGGGTGVVPEPGAAPQPGTPGTGLARGGIAGALEPQVEPAVKLEPGLVGSTTACPDTAETAESP
jgi:hypothetical protein